MVPDTLHGVWGIGSSNLNHEEGYCDPVLVPRRKLSFSGASHGQGHAASKKGWERGRRAPGTTSWYREGVPE